MALGIDPNADKRPILPEGTYGEQGEVELTRICAQQVPKSDPPQHYVAFTVKVSSPEGVQFIDGNAFDPCNTRIGPNTGSVVRSFAAQLGLNADDLQFDEQPEDMEATVKRHALLGHDPCPMKVIVDIGLNTWKDKATREERSRNFIKNIEARN